MQVEIIEKPIIGNPYLKYKSFKKIPNEFLITEETPEGTTVYAADFPKTIKLSLKKYHQPNSRGFPWGGYTLWNPKYQVIYSCYLDAAMIHPDNKKKHRKTKRSRKSISFFE